MASASAAAPAPEAAQPQDWTPLDAAVRAQIAAGTVPGAVAIVGDAEQVWLRRAWGWRARGPAPEPMTVDTVFDLASLTKVVCTTTAVLQLAERGRIRIDAPVAQYWPAFAAHGKQAITVAQLLSHSSGLRAGLTLQPADRGEAVFRKLLDEAPVHPPGSALLYSDLNFLALGVLVQRVSHEPLDRYCQRHVFRPLQMRDTGFQPAHRLASRIAPTEPEAGGGWLRGTVHDPTARRAGGVAGNAGLFGTADDLARFAQALLKGGHDAPLSAASLRALRQPQGAASTTAWHGFGWQLLPPLAAEREAMVPLGAIGHTGYTGTGLWIDFVNRRFVVLLSNRLHPDGRGDARPLRRAVLALVSSLLPPQPSLPRAGPTPRLDDAPAKVRTGIDVLRDQGYAALQGRRVGLVTHLAAIDRHGWRTLDRLRHAPGVTLVRVFTPEHGLHADAEGRIASGTEPFSGLPLVSLYGTARRPAPEALQGLDTLVVDLQDAGVRYYTYLATLGESLHAAAQAGVKVVVLDRPDPLRADRMAGPMLDAGLRSFTAYTTLPVQHGMTLGELARYLVAEMREQEGLTVDLQVIAMQGYRRTMWFDETGLDWVPPSPNLRRASTAVLYAGVAWVEGANVSVGRGTDRPFEWLGAPWIDGPQLAAGLNALALPGVAVQPVEFVPDAAPYASQRCHGVALRVTERDRFEPALLGAALVQTLQRLWPAQFQADRTLGMIGSAEVLRQLKQGEPLQAVQARWAASWGDVGQRREAALLYGGPAR